MERKVAEFKKTMTKKKAFYWETDYHQYVLVNIPFQGNLIHRVLKALKWVFTSKINIWFRQDLFNKGAVWEMEKDNDKRE